MPPSSTKQSTSEADIFFSCFLSALYLTKHSFGCLLRSLANCRGGIQEKLHIGTPPSKTISIGSSISRIQITKDNSFEAPLHKESVNIRCEKCTLTPCTDIYGISGQRRHKWHKENCESPEMVATFMLWARF